MVSKYYSDEYGYKPERIYYTDGDAIYVRDAVGEEEAETLYTAEDSRVISIGGSDVVLFFMTADYDVYRLHLPSGTVDFMCNTAFDFETAQEWHREYRDYQDWQSRAYGAENVGNEEEIARLYEIPYEEWDAEKAARKADGKEYWYWLDEGNHVTPDCGALDILSNNDIRFTVLAPDWEPTDIDIGNRDTDWFSHITFGSGSYFYGDYVTYSAALGKFGATDRALDLLGIPEEQRMTFDEFVDYYGGTPPHSGI